MFIVLVYRYFINYKYDGRWDYFNFYLVYTQSVFVMSKIIYVFHIKFMNIECIKTNLNKINSKILYSFNNIYNVLKIL